MSARTVLIYLSILAVVPFAVAKKKQVLPNYVLQAETVAVVIQPDAGEPATNPAANRTAQENVEKALSQWGRFRLVPDAQTADLVVAVRKGHTSGPTITNSPSDNPPVTIQTGGGTTRVGAQQGHPPDLSNPGPLGPPGPRVGDEIGASEDTFAVYQGRVEYPLDAAPVWRYTEKNALNGPEVQAVEQFRRALTEAEKQHQQKP